MKNPQQIHQIIKWLLRLIGIVLQHLKQVGTIMVTPTECPFFLYLL